MSPRDLSDLRLLAWGAYEPLRALVGEEDHRRIVSEMRVASGALWPWPIALAVDEAASRDLRGAASADVYDPTGQLLGAVRDLEIYRIAPEDDAADLFGTTDPAHPGVEAMLRAGPWRAGGYVDMDDAALAMRPPFDRHPARPADVRSMIAERGWRTTVFFQTRNPIHRAHEYLTKCALETVDGLVVHPLVGETKGDDVPAEVRLRCYETLLMHYYPADRTLLALFPAHMRYAGPREAIFHALVRRNFGATHFIVGRDHAGVGEYYGTYEAQQALLELGASALGVVPVPFEHTFWCHACGGMCSGKTCPHDPGNHLHLSGTAVRKLLADGLTPPAEFTRPEVASLLAEAYKDKTATE